jgi:hypothetical protein
MFCALRSHDPWYLNVQNQEGYTVGPHILHRWNYKGPQTVHGPIQDQWPMKTYILGYCNSIELENCEHNIHNQDFGINTEVPIWDLIRQQNDWGSSESCPDIPRTQKTIYYGLWACQDTVESWNGVVSTQKECMVWCARPSVVLFIIFTICFLFIPHFL